MTWVAGSYPTAAQFNAEIKDSLNFLANPPACRVYHNVAQSIANVTMTALAFNSERYDWSSPMHDVTTNNTRITIVTAGLYVVTGHVRWAANGTGIRYVDIALNAAATSLAVDRRPQLGAGEPVEQSVATVWRFAAGDYVVLRGYQSSTVALNVEVVGNYSPEFSATWVGK